MNLLDRIKNDLAAEEPEYEGEETGQSIHHLAEKKGWLVEYTPRHHAVSISVCDIENMKVYGGYGEDDVYAWRSVAKDYNNGGRDLRDVDL